MQLRSSDSIDFRPRMEGSYCRTEVSAAGTWTCGGQQGSLRDSMEGRRRVRGRAAWSCAGGAGARWRLRGLGLLYSYAVCVAVVRGYAPRSSGALALRGRGGALALRGLRGAGAVESVRELSSEAQTLLAERYASLDALGAEEDRKAEARESRTNVRRGKSE